MRRRLPAMRAAADSSLASPSDLTNGISLMG
jgi:hypothetical protein